MSVDSGMIIVIIISMMYMVLVFGLLFHVKNDWCDLLLKNFTVITAIFSDFWWPITSSRYIFAQSASLSPYKWLFRLSVCLSLLASREVSREAIGIKAV